METCSENEKEIKETIADLLLNLNNHLNSLQSSTSSDCDRDHVTLNGLNVGAATIINPCHTEGQPGHHFCINIYVTNNVQGVNNSILLESKVAMRDPGARLSFPLPHNVDEKRKKRRKKSSYRVTLFCTISILFVLLLVWAGNFISSIH